MSCQSMQPETFIDPTKIKDLSSSICAHCGQVISTLTKQTQLDDYLSAHTFFHDEKVDFLKLKKRQF
ncbi:hypothetical protein [Aquirhabdus parva]|uniref:Uncharacterized protein n=1 Tax=Aquirhabdus parva TaxID=2283318 RepID=A0A345P9B3_9GAMM|nr:hypothetical protein [Aquirhabdus parva]AXI03872.1 hypothetical protein HYN46_14115 [Aquirhabdus parva]